LLVGLNPKEESLERIAMMRTRIAGFARIAGVQIVVVPALWLGATGAGAQQPPAASALPPPGAPQTTVAPSRGPTPIDQASATTDPAALVPVPTELVLTQPGGLTSDVVGARAASTSWNAKASLETLRGASARVDEAWASFLPRLSGVARYTRLSPLTPPSISLNSPINQPGGTVTGTVYTNLPAASNPMIPQVVCTAALPCMAVATGNFSFPVVLDNWLLQGTLTVPISDYFLRIEQGYTAATRSEDAARWDVVTARAASGSNGKIAFYTWLRNRGAVVVAVQTLNDQKNHLRDARNQFNVGNASKADVLRAETSLSSAELALERAKNLADLSEKQLRVAVHAGDAEVFMPGEDLEVRVAPVPGNIKQLTLEALTARPEIKSADANAVAARETAAAAKASRYPVLSAFADGIVANPNSRVFPQSNTWFPSWDLGAQLTWSPNDTLVANGIVTDNETRAAAIEANANTVRDNIEVEVTQDWQGVREADFSIEASVRELASAEEAYRVQRELFNNGRGTSTTLTDAETDLTRARLDLLNARADSRIARIRLAHAVGRDASAP
jgi:outer membrane protein TolC